MKKRIKDRQDLTGRVFLPLAAGVVILCAALFIAVFAALYPAARDASRVGWLIFAMAAGFLLTGGGMVYLILGVCRRYLDPITQAAAAVTRAAGGDHSSSLSGIPRTSDETAALLDAAGNMGERSNGCLMELEGVLHQIAEGDLTACLPCGKGAECGGACGALEDMAQKLRGGIGSVRSALDQMTGQLNELERDVQQLSQSSQNRREDREAMTRSLDRLNERLQNRTESAQAVHNEAESLSLRLTEFEKRIEELSQAIGRIGDCAAEAGKIVKTMESTAFQCSVLARTAYMEAAGAGVNGKGFAVVASEMRVLASHSAQAAQDAAALVGEMDRTIREGTALTTEASRELRSVLGGGKELCRLAAGAEEESRETKEVHDAVRQAARQTSAAAEDRLLANRTAVSAAVLRDRAARLREALRVFRLS